MVTFGKVGVAIIMGLTLSLTLFTSGVFPYNFSHSHSSAAAHTVLVANPLKGTIPTRQNFDTRRSDHQQISYQQFNYQQTSREKGACSSQSACQNASRCIRIYKSSWGWIFICNEGNAVVTNLQ